MRKSVPKNKRKKLQWPLLDYIILFDNDKCSLRILDGTSLIKKIIIIKKIKKIKKPFSQIIITSKLKYLHKTITFMLGVNPVIPIYF